MILHLRQTRESHSEKDSEGTVQRIGVDTTLRPALVPPIALLVLMPFCSPRILPAKCLVGVGLGDRKRNRCTTAFRGRGDD